MGDVLNRLNALARHLLHGAPLPPRHTPDSYRDEMRAIGCSKPCVRLEHENCGGCGCPCHEVGED